MGFLRSKTFYRQWLLTCVGCLLAAPLPTAPLLAAPRVDGENILELVPKEALGYVVVHGLAEVNQKLATQAQRLELPLPDLLALLKQKTEFRENLDEQGDGLLVLLPPLKEGEPPQPLVALPVTDYETLVKQFDPGAADPITQVTIAGEAILMAHRAGHAILVNLENRSAVEKFLASSAQRSPDRVQLASWQDSNDVAVVIMPRGVQMATALGIGQLEKIKQQISQAGNLGIQTDQVIASLDMYLQLFRATGREVRLVAKGFRIDQAGSLQVGARVRFRKEGILYDMLEPTQTAAANLLVGLPGGPFMGAAGATLSPASSKLLARWSIAVMQNNPGLYGMQLSAGAAEKYLDMLAPLAESFRSFSMVMAPNAEDETVMDCFYAVMEVEDTAAFLAGYQRAMREFQKLMADADGSFPYKMELTDSQIGHAKGLAITMDLNAIWEAQQIPEASKPMLDKMYGEGGKLTTYLLAVDKQRILASYGSERVVARHLAGLNDAGSGLVRKPGVAQTAKRLPRTACLVAYLSPPGLVAGAKQIAGHFLPASTLSGLPEFPDTPAIGFSARTVAGGLETELVVPAELPPASRDYIRQVRP